METKYHNPDCSYLIGALADRSLYSNKRYYVNRITYYQHSREYLEHCIDPRIQYQFGKKGHFYFDRRKLVYYYEITSKALYQIYLELAESFKADENRCVPCWIQKGSKPIQYGFLSGFFDADGWYYFVPEKHDFRVRFGQAEFQVLQDIKIMLEPKFNCSEVLGPYQSKLEAKPYYELHLHGKHQVIQFHGIIKPCHPDKQLEGYQFKNHHQGE